MRVLWIFSVLILLALQACGKQEPATPSASDQSMKTASQSDFDAMYKDAVDSLEAINKKGNAWRDTGKLIKEAKAAADSNDLDKAVKLVKSAKDQTELAQQQLEGQKNAGPWLFN